MSANPRIVPPKLLSIAILLSSLVVALSPLPALASEPSPELADKASLVDRYMSRWHQIGRFSGSVLVARNGEVLFKKGYGLANREWNVANEPDTRFCIRSISKQFTTVLVLQLAAEGKIALDGKLSEYLPEYRKDTGSRVTIDQLLRHTSGIPCYINDGHRRTPGKPVYSWGGNYEREDFIRGFLSDDLLFEPGSRYKYSNTGYYLLALVVEAVTGRTYEENLQERIFGPLEMADSGVDSRDLIIPRRADGYTKMPGGFLNAPYDNPHNLLGAGNLYSTVEDLLLWNLALDTDRLLPREWQEKMFEVYWKEPHNEHAYSLNYFTYRRPTGEEVRFTGFSGGGEGFSTDAFRFPDVDLIVIILDNSTQYNHWMMGRDIYEILAGGTPRTPLPLASDVVAEVLVRKGLEAALDRYREIQQGQDDTYDMGALESEINSFGYSALKLKQFDLAISLFKLNVELFPNSWNVYDSLGEAYLASGREELSAEAYGIAKVARERESTLMSLMRSGAFEEARAVVEKIHHESPGVQLLQSARVGPLFEESLMSGDHAKALEICHLWAEACPGAVGPYFSMARVYRTLGNATEAKACYRKILEIQPEGRAAEAARRALERAD